MVYQYSADDIVEINGKLTAIKDIPNANLRATFGVGHFPGHGREVVSVPNRVFEFTPETCLTDLYSGRGEWVNDGKNLICRGCGLDCT